MLEGGRCFFWFYYSINHRLFSLVSIQKVAEWGIMRHRATFFNQLESNVN